MYEYRGRVDRVIDGDTIQVTIDLGFYTERKGVRLRIQGFDAEEMRDRNPERQARAQEAKDLLINKLTGAELLVRTYKRKSGSYLKTFDRFVADVMYRYPGEDTYTNIIDDLEEAGLEKLPRVGS